MLYGSKWLDAIVLLKILGLSLALRSALGESFGHLAYLTGKTKFILFWNIVHNIVKLTLGTFLIYKFGALGGAFYMLTAFVAISLIPRFYIIKKVLNSFQFLRSVWQPILAGLITLIILKNQSYFIQGLNTQIILMLQFVVIYILLLLMFDKQIRKLCKNLFIDLLRGTRP